MGTIHPTIEDFEEIIAFYSTLNRRDFDPIIEWKGGEKIEGNVNFMRWPIYDPVVKVFFMWLQKGVGVIIILINM